MKPSQTGILGTFLIIGLLITTHLIQKRDIQPIAPPGETSESTPSPTIPAQSPTAMPVFYTPPVRELRARVSKKQFGTYVTPANSPVQPERFEGYHTGIDVEFTDTTDEVPVYAMSSGIVTLSRFVNGYGGVVIIRHSLNQQTRHVLYGHLDPDTLPQIGREVHTGEEIGQLGEGFTRETDQERKHLHLAILTKNGSDLRGYVANEATLHSNWEDPLLYFP